MKVVEPESEEEEDDDVDMDDMEDMEEGSFHSEEDGSDEGSEDLKMSDDPETLRLHARMQAAMEAAEKRATGKEPENQTKPKTKASNSTKSTETAVPVEELDRSEFDMGPMMLPASVLSAAAATEARKKKLMARKAELARAEEARRTKRKNRNSGVEKKQRKIKCVEDSLLSTHPHVTDTCSTSQR
jgi:hypothetical protein